MSFTISIDTSSTKAKAFIAFVKTLDFVKIIDDKDICTFSDEQKEAIDKAIQSVKKGRVTSHEIVMERFKNSHPKYFSE